MTGRSRVSSLLANFTKYRDSQNSPTTPLKTREDDFKSPPPRQEIRQTPDTPVGPQNPPVGLDGEEPLRTQPQRQRASSRPQSMIQTYQPPLMDVAHDTLPELQPIFTFLNSHGNKLYQEGYFLKLDDQDTYGRPNADRTWTECFAQLVGTVLSLWDASELDTAGQDGEVLPKFINLTDSSIKMIESLPTRSDKEPPLQNVLSISTAGKNRYLLHFNSHHSLIQWTAGIRLAMFEHATLQEAYTGALIAGKGKALNNINLIMEQTRTVTEDWARVRFGAGTPWRRCWCVITPPDQKEVQKLQKAARSKKSAYDRSALPTLKGDIKFYDNKKTKKVQPIATITDAYSAFAIYPQAKPLIDASTLVKVEGSITIHSNPPSTTEGFVFVMPEVHPAVSGFEMMLRWLFPVFDTFALYGRPTRLIADTSNPRSLMFAMPRHRRYGYLEILDVSSLIHEPGSSSWRESEWRRRMKELTGKRMATLESGSQRNSQYGGRRSARNSFGPSRSKIQFDDAASTRSSPSVSWQQGPPAIGIPRTDSAPPAEAFRAPATTHHRSASQPQGLDRYANVPSTYDGAYEQALPPPPPAHGSGVPKYRNEMAATPERVSSEDERGAQSTPVRELRDMQVTSVPEPVAPPPAFSHTPGALPISKPYHSPELRRANSRMSHATLAQITGGAAGATHRANQEGRQSEDQRRVLPATTNNYEYPANRVVPNEGPVTGSRSITDAQSASRSTDSDSQLYSSQPYPHLPYRPLNTQSDTRKPISSQGALISGQSSFPSSNSNNSTTSQLPAKLPTSAVQRKALPQNSILHSPVSAMTSSSVDTLNQRGFDSAAFDMVKTPAVNEMPGSLPESARFRSDTVTSDYDDSYYDNDSTVSPDYASTTRPSFDTRKSVEKPRAGVLRTVGNVESGKRPSTEIPSIDFGPTLNLNSKRPAAPHVVPPAPTFQVPRKPSPGRSPSPGTNSHQNNERRPQSTVLSRSPDWAPDGHYRTASAEGRTMAWQPGMGSGSAAKPQGLTPEQFVQQRAAAAVPQYAHSRTQSGNTLGRNTPTPPLVRPRSGDAPSPRTHSRQSSADLLQRPSSRGASAALGPSGNGDIPSNLSAREQQHIARVTGQPLVNLAGSARPGPSGLGLVGAIEYREKEKQQMKQGINSQAVQHAIEQRQQQSMYTHAPQSSYGGMGQYPSYVPVNQQQQRQWAPPVPTPYAQEFSPPSPSVYAGSPDLGSAVMQTPPGVPSGFPQQYFGQQRPSQQGHARGNSGYRQ